MAHQYRATLKWTRGGAVFTDQRYSRGHTWSFDGGITVPGSSSPLSVRLPYSVAEAIETTKASSGSIAASTECGNGTTAGEAEAATSMPPSNRQVWARE